MPATNLEPTIIADLLHQSMGQGRKPFINVSSDSMAPLIRPGDSIRLAPTSTQQLAPGDIVVVCGSAGLLTHRYWGCQSRNGRSQLLTKGDRPKEFDLPRPVESLVGRVVARKRGDRLLTLTRGSGLWLNRRLAEIALLEIRLFANSTRPTSGISANGLASAFSDTRAANSLASPIRRTLYFWARLLTESIDVAAMITEVS